MASRYLSPRCGPKTEAVAIDVRSAGRAALDRNRSTSSPWWPIVLEEGVVGGEASPPRTRTGGAPLVDRHTPPPTTPSGAVRVPGAATGAHLRPGGRRGAVRSRGSN